MTKAEEFKRAAQLAAHATKTPKLRKDRIANQATHNEGASHTKTSSYELEVSATARPSRKSTRKSLNRQKTDSALRITRIIHNAAPSTRTAQR